MFLNVILFGLAKMLLIVLVLSVFIVARDAQQQQQQQQQQKHERLSKTDLDADEAQLRWPQLFAKVRRVQFKKALEQCNCS